MRPKADESLATWKEKLLKGKKEGTYSYKFKSERTTITDTNKKELAGIILKNAKEGKQGNTKIATGKTAFADDVENVLESKTYKAGDTISFDTYKTQAENLWLKAECQGDTIKYEGEFLKRDGEYFVIGNGNCTRCEEEISLKQIEDLFGAHSRSKEFREDVVKYLNQFINQRKNTDKPIHLNTCLRKAHFFAQVGAETMGINTDWIVETDVMSYNPDNIRDRTIFGDRSGILERRGQIETFCADRPQIRLLSFLYANENRKGNGNGNEASQDGYKFRGRGLKQLTGRDNYKDASKTLKDIFPDEYIDLEAHPDKVKEAKYAVLSAIAYWEKHEIWKTADTIKVSTKSEIKKIRKMVNGGFAGWDKAKKHFEKGIEIFKVNQCSPVELSSGNWHNPVDNPRLTKYNFGGNEKPSSGTFGECRRNLDGTKKYHGGFDFFGKPGVDKVYSCLQGNIVQVRYSATAGWIVRIKVKNTKEILEQEGKVNYQLQYTDEWKGRDITQNDDVYLIYMHLHSVFFTTNDALNNKEINAGTPIGLLGVSGSIANGGRAPHLHMEVATVMDPYTLGRQYRTNPARFVKLNPYNTDDQDIASRTSHR